ncbi:uncharacterized protein LOC112639720 [Camponotus floridanus]|uniref:uncharacterized protein LOC112639720 n=1 Tax=Camponotus floridanus TaxID=104421 RepID=UPI000DC69CE1|nr:uncharacterized protein LOC112639720 [Camponotus floridanus]
MGRFGDPDYQYALRDEIFRRTQGEYEIAADYLTCLRALLSRMSPPWALEEQLNFAHRNMLPRMQIAIRRQEFRDFATLENLATRMERSLQAEKHYRPPLPPEQSLFPDLAYHAPKNKNKNAATVATANVTAKRKEKKKAAKTPNVNTATTDTGTATATAMAAAAATESSTTAPEILLPLREARCNRTNLPDMLGKRESEPVERVPTTPSPEGETLVTADDTVGDDTLLQSYVTLGREELPSLKFFKIKIYDYTLAALVDSGSNRTLLGREGIKIIRELGLDTERGRGIQNRTANGQIANIREEIKVPLELEDQCREITVALLPNLAVPCILGLDFLTKFGVTLDFATNGWYFAESPHKKYRLVTEVDPNESSCCGISELTPAQEKTLDFFLRTLPQTSDNPGVTTLTEHKIDVGDSPPIKQRCYLVSPKVQEAIRAETDKMLQAGIIEPSYSEWSNPIVMVKKPNGKYRFCLDFRKVNDVSKKDAYPLPNINGILDKLRSARYISTIDLSQAYFQIPLAKESREITAFSVPGKGLFHFTRMPYGLTGAPATYKGTPLPRRWRANLAVSVIGGIGISKWRYGILKWR